MVSRQLAVLFATLALFFFSAEALALEGNRALPAFSAPLTLRGSVPSVQKARRTNPAVVSAHVPKMQLAAPKTGGGGRSTVLEKRPTIKTAPEENLDQTPDKPYHVLLFNDPMNTREYVCDVLCEIFGHSKSKAYDIMQTAHTTGFAVCNTTDKEEADSQSAKLGEKNLMSSVVKAD
mmetsp:Transcript_22023/g.52219  ORF Transcript_22023/g.52219 Transcript_22023/m.52219 type:complete len:177 (+) Transcript_22023:144-674(+)|eukprot:20445-Rhodomonas_salina.2